jgi:peptidoglycan/LPS O-acetylase OafA/YrhL
MELEGLRGVAALIVVIYHFMIAFYPNIAFGANSLQHMRFEDNLYGSPLSVFLSGGFAVGIFFVLSGFVLSIGFFQTKDESIVKKLASKRYLRLMLPALASVIISFILLSLNFDANRDPSVAITQSGVAGEWNFALNFFDALRQGTFGIFFESVRYYNPVLWTMTYEFIGSFIVFLFLFSFGKSQYRWLVYGLLLFATFGTWYLAIIIGTILADLYAHNKLPLGEGRPWIGTSLLVLGLFLGGYPFGEPQGTIYSPLYIASLGVSANIAIYISFGALLTIMGILSLRRVSAFFASRYISILGKYTYSLYLTHALVILTLTSTLFMLFIGSMGYNLAVFFAVLGSIPAIIIVTWLFERYVDAPSIKLANFFSDAHHKDREIKLLTVAKDYVSVLKSKLAFSKVNE